MRVMLCGSFATLEVGSWMALRNWLWEPESVRVQLRQFILEELRGLLEEGDIYIPPADPIGHRFMDP